MPKQSSKQAESHDKAIQGSKFTREGRAQCKSRPRPLFGSKESPTMRTGMSPEEGWRGFLFDVPKDCVI